MAFDAQKYLAGVDRLPAVMEKLGIKEFRKGQGEAIASAMGGKDSIVLLPTGTGKSAVFIVPTLAMEWQTLVFVPLVALMQNHLEGLLRKGIRAGQLSSLQTPKENEMVIQEYQNGNLDILLVAPERIRNEKFQEALKNRPPNMIAVDECHCLSQWGVNFRPEYCKIADVIKEVNPDVVLGLTATARDVVVQDVVKLLDLSPDMEKIVYMPPRKNLRMESSNYRGDYDLVRKINSLKGSGIVYFSTVTALVKAYEEFGGMIEGGALIYHGQMTPSAKAANQEMWTSGETRVVFCTNAFGMGIDKPDTRWVIFRSIPGSIEDLVQGFGRAGRDQNPATCIVYYDAKGENTQRRFIESGNPTEAEVKRFYQAVSSNLNSEGLCDLRISDLCKQASVSEWSGAALMNAFYAFKVFERTRSEKTVSVRFLEEPDAADLSAIKMLNMYREVVETYGVQSGNFYDIDIEFIAQELRVGQPTVRRHLLNLDEKGYIVFVPPQRGAPIKVVGTIEQVDFGLLERMRQDAFHNLELVKEFFGIPDGEGKEEYITEFFRSEYGAKI